MSGVMFRESMTAAAPVAVAQQRLLTRLNLDGLQPQASRAVADGAEVLLRAAVGPISKTVAVSSVAPYLREDTVVFPIRWVATGPLGTLLPSLEANIELSPTSDPDPGHTVIVFIGSYRPPFGRVGTAIDRALLHRATAATARAFIAELSAAVATPPTELANETADEIGDAWPI
jgi:hypothetical protein